MPVIEWFSPNDADFTMKDFVIDILQRCFVATFETLIRTNGAAEVMAAMKPHMKVTLRNYLQGIQKGMQIEGTGPDSLITVFNAAQAFVVPTEAIESEITDLGAVETVHACPFQGSVPEICVYFSHFASEEVCQMMNPDYECVFTHHLTNGDPYCRCVFKKRDHSLKDPEDLGTTIAKMPELKIPDEQLHHMKLGGISMQLNAVTSAFVHMNGSEKVKEALYPNSRRIGQEAADLMRRDMPCFSESAETLGLVVSSLAQVLNQNYAPKVATPDEFAVEVSDCPCQTFSPEFCGQIGALFDGLVQTLNPEFEFRYIRKMTTGDKVCRWTVRRRAAPYSVDDPINVIKMRLAMGEISEEEYARIKALIEKR